MIICTAWHTNSGASDPTGPATRYGRHRRHARNPAASAAAASSKVHVLAASGLAPKGPGVEDGTLSFRVYRDPARADYLLFVEHFADQAAYDAHTSSPAYQDLIAGQFADVIVEFVEIDHELVVAL
jgi:quinol monooxygenase YgiN